MAASAFGQVRLPAGLLGSSASGQNTPRFSGTFMEKRAFFRIFYEFLKIIDWIFRTFSEGSGYFMTDNALWSLFKSAQILAVQTKEASK
jgi:hypothetical protein